MNFDRLKQLSGKNPRQEIIDKLTESRSSLLENYDRSLELLKQNYQLDEGIFDSLKMALRTATEVGKLGGEKAVTKVKSKAAKLSTSVKELYKSAKMRAELKELAAGLQKLVDQFENLSKKTPTLINQDAEIKKELLLFKDVFLSTRDAIWARLQVSEGKTVSEETIDEIIGELLGEELVTEESRVAGLKKEAEKAIVDAARKLSALKSALTDTDDKEEVRSAETYLDNALGKLKEVVSE